MDNELDIAIVGMACRFPGARDLEEFWKNLASGVESITTFTDQELAASGLPAAWLLDPTYVKAAPVLEDPGHFDAAFFGYTPGEARGIDPQHRVLLELAHAALEDAGCDPQRYPGRIGVFSGAALNTYFTSIGLASRLAEDYIPTLIGNDKDFLSTRISYKLNLKGPSITVQTACSTSLVAIHLARQSLLTGESDMALAGAVSVRVPHRAGYFYDSGGVVSPDGHVRAFDARANGTVFGSGGGIVVLKRVGDALADGDLIHAVIKGSAVNNDGAEKAGYSAPSVASQADAVVEALANAAVPAESITYVETHGSGTPVGDPVEIRALTEAFRTSTQRRGYCAIGSVKTNIGHLDAAAGIAGLIKTVLALKHRMLPPSLHFSQPNPEIDFPASPFFVNTQLRDWASPGPRRAGVMSTGMGGTNAHVILEEAPARAAALGEQGAQHLLVLSAKTDSALEAATSRLRSFLENAGDVNIADVAHTLQIGRKALSHRRCLVCSDREDAIAGLGRDMTQRALSGVTDGARRPVILLLPGIGDQYVGMGYGLYGTFDAFREEVDRCAQILEPHLGIDIRTVLYPATGAWKGERKAKGVDLKKMLGRDAGGMQNPETEQLNRTLYAQPALFTIEYATSRLWQALGITFEAIVGHSMGEYVAACLAGVLSLEDALQLVATRARLVDQLPQGAMLAVALPESELLRLLPDEVSVAVINGPRLAVVAGPGAAIAEFERTLNAKGVTCRHVQNGHAFHSRMLDPIAGPLEREARRIRLNTPTVPYISNVTGTWIARRDAIDPAYWALHATRTARFSDALHELWRFADPILLEAGPGRTLSVLAMQHPERSHLGDAMAVSSIRHDYENQPDAEFLWTAIGKLWLAGAEIRWDKTPSRGRKTTLPTYPFERQNYWIEMSPQAASNRQERPAGKRNFDEWFYAPVWKRAPPSRISRCVDTAILWLVFADSYGGGQAVKAHLESLGCEVSFVRFSDRFARGADGSFGLNPAKLEDYVSLFETLTARTSPNAISIVHLGTLLREHPENLAGSAASRQELGFYSLLHIAQAIGELNLSIPIKIGIISNRLHEVTGEERVAPEMATVLGPCGVIPKELPNVKCFNLDLPDDRPIDDLAAGEIAPLVAEFAEPAQAEVVAYRGRYRWHREFERVSLEKAPPATMDASPSRGRLRTNGVYLITGGTGGIGLSVSRYLAEACKPAIILTKQSAFPEKSTWKQLSLTREAPQRVLRTIDALMEVERCGARVEVHQADVTEPARMESVLRDVRERYGAIHGVIHAAGIVRAELIQGKSRPAAHGVLAPKVYGTLTLLDLVKDLPLDFLVLFSSITAVETPYAHCDYSAANCFLDACTYAANARHRFHTLTINWPGWKEIGQLADLKATAGLENWKKAALEKAISTREGVEAFARALHSGLKQVIVSPEDLHQVIASARKPVDPSQYLSPARATGTRTAPRMLDGADAPTNDVETALAEIWESTLGLEHIGIHEPFSQLGGHSLLAMQIVSKVRASYEIRLTLREFFEAATIAGLARLVQAKIVAEIEMIPDDQARALVTQQ